MWPIPPNNRRWVGSGPWLPLASLLLSLLALGVASFGVILVNFRMAPILAEVHKLRALTDVRKMHNTIEEQPVPGGTTRDYRLRLLNVDTRPVEDLRVVVEVFENRVTLPPAANIQISPPIRAAVTVDPSQAVIRFDESLPPGKAVDITIKGFGIDPNFNFHTQLKTWIYTREGPAIGQYTRLNPK